MDYMKLLALIPTILNVIGKIQTALKSGGNVIAMIQGLAPDVLPVLQQLGAILFPDLSATQQTNAGALVLSNDIVSTVQSQLNALNITDGSGRALTVDGIYGSLTKQAVAKFQQANGLSADGWAGPLTQAALTQAVAKRSQ